MFGMQQTPSSNIQENNIIVDAENIIHEVDYESDQSSHRTGNSNGINLERNPTPNELHNTSKL